MEVMEIMVAGAVAVEADSMEEAMQSYLETEDLDAEENVDKAKVVMVDVGKEDRIENKGSTLMLTFPVSQTILTSKYHI